MNETPWVRLLLWGSTVLFCGACSSSSSPSATPTPACTAGDACEDGNPCTDGSCRDGECRQVPHNRPCDDGLACTVDERCFHGECLGFARRSCEDGDPCTEDACAEAQGCTHLPRTGPCSGPCTEGGQCVQGRCQGEQPRDCDDDNPCTHDSCDLADGCRNVPLAGECSDGDPCTEQDRCQDGRCLGHPRDADGDGHAAASCGGPDCCDGGGEDSPGCSPELAARIHPGAAETLGEQVDADCDSLPGPGRESCGGIDPGALLRADNGLGLTSRAMAPGDVALVRYAVEEDHREIRAVEGVLWDFDCNTGEGRGVFSALVFDDVDGLPGRMLAVSEPLTVQRDPDCWDEQGQANNLVVQFPLPVPVARSRGQACWVGLRAEQDQRVDFLTPVLDGGTLDAAQVSAFFSTERNRTEQDLPGNWLIRAQGCAAGPRLHLAGFQTEPVLLPAGGSTRLTVTLENRGGEATGPLHLAVQPPGPGFGAEPSVLEGPSLAAGEQRDLGEIVLGAPPEASGGQTWRLGVTESGRQWDLAARIFVNGASCATENHSLPVAGELGAALPAVAGLEVANPLRVQAKAFHLTSLQATLHRSPGAGTSRYRARVYSSREGRPETLLAESAEVSVGGEGRVQATFPLPEPLSLAEGDEVWAALVCRDTSPTELGRPWFGPLLNDGKFKEGSDFGGIRRDPGGDWTPLYYAVALLPRGCKPADLGVVARRSEPGVIEPGAEVQLYLTVRNDGALAAQQVQATLTSPDPEVQVERGVVNLGLLEAGTQREGEPFLLQVSPAATELQYLLDVELRDGALRWSERLPLRLRGARVDLAVQELSTSKVGNRIHYRLELANTGNVDEPGVFRVDVYSHSAAAPALVTAGSWVFTLEGLAAGQSWSKDWYRREVPAGTWSAWARLDRLEGVEDADRSNDLAGPSTQQLVAEELFCTLEPLQRWFEMPMPYRFVTGNEQQGMVGRGREAVRVAYDSWAAVDPAHLSFVEQPEAGSGEGGYRLDRRNTVTFGDPLGEVATGVLAQAVISIDSQQMDLHGEQAYRIIDADLVFNDGIPYVTHEQAGSPDCSRGYDLQGVATHEIGHLLGLAHVEVSGAVMVWQQPACTTDFAVLSRSEECGVGLLYGRPCP